MSQTMIGLLLLLLLVTGCSGKKADSKAAAGSTPEKPAAAVGKRTALPLEFTASGHSDAGNWKSGINRLQRSQFLYAIGKDQPTPLLPGHRLHFAAAGAAAVVSVFRLDGPAHASIFVTVDKELDPERDGNPFPIRITGLSLQAANYSKEGRWERGISLREQGTFLLVVEKKAVVPFAAGDRLRFAAAGEAAILKVVRQKGTDKFDRVFVTVDRTLSPGGDGHPSALWLVI